MYFVFVDLEKVFDSDKGGGECQEWVDVNVFSFHMKYRLYTLCGRSVMRYGIETLKHNEMCMVLCG